MITHMSADPHYLVGLDLAGRRVVVVGGGTVAQRRLPRLLAAGAEIELIAPHATPAVEAMAAAGELRRTARSYADGDLDGAWYALACTDDPAVNAAVVAEAERRRVFCVRADAGTSGSAVTPAVGRARRAAGRRALRRTPAPIGRGAHGARRGAGGRASLTTEPTRSRPAWHWSAAVPGTPS